MKVIELERGINTFLERLSIEVDGLRMAVQVLENPEDIDYYREELLARETYLHRIIQEIIHQEMPDIDTVTYTLNYLEGRIEVYDKD